EPAQPVAFSRTPAQDQQGWAASAPAQGWSTQPASKVIASAPGGAQGRPRNYWVVLLLSFVTLGVYGYVYMYKAFREVDLNSGQRHRAGIFWGMVASMAPYVLLLLLPMLLVSVAGEAWDWLILVMGIGALLGTLALVAAAVLSILYMVFELGQLRHARQQAGLAPVPGTAEYFLWAILGAFIIVGPFIALYKVNRSINEYWQRFGRPPA
ncbi:MAG TPA: DUF4234 domain-containing protein, partial [Candidatus Thermoplasmatota archaeon]|nr:DUF4234 domain-containing protein [Candidatus Thermoplasmatota archaeon]